MKKFLVGFIAGAIARHYTFPQLTSNELIEEFRTTIQRLNDRLDAKEQTEAKSPEQTPEPPTPPVDQP